MRHVANVLSFLSEQVKTKQCHMGTHLNWDVDGRPRNRNIKEGNRSNHTWVCVKKFALRASDWYMGTRQFLGETE